MNLTIMSRFKIVQTELQKKSYTYILFTQNKSFNKQQVQ